MVCVIYFNLFCIERQFLYRSPGGGGGAYIWEGDIRNLLHFEFGGLYL